MCFDPGPSLGHAGADLQHMRAQRILSARLQMIGVVLHKSGSAVFVFAHGFHDRQQRRHFPIALAAETVALRHQILSRQTRQLLQAVQILEGIRKGPAALTAQHPLDGDFLPGLIGNGLPVFRGKIVFFQIRRHLGIDLIFRNRGHFRRQITYRPGIDLPAEFQLGLDFIALGHGNISHIVSKTHDLHVPGHGNANRRSHPAAQPLRRGRVLPIARDDFPRQAQPCPRETMLPVSMRRLVQVHEIHIDLVIGDIPVILRHKMAVGLPQSLQTAEPHLAG